MDVRSARRLAVSLRSGVRGARERPLVFALSVATMAAGLLVVGSYLLIAANLRGVLERVGAELKLVAFTSAGATSTKQEIDALAARLRALPGVADLHFVAPDEAMARLRGDLGEDADVLDGMARNPLPGSFELVVDAEHREPAELRALADRVGALSGIGDVRFGEAWVEGYARVVRTVEWLGVGLGAFLVLVLGAIVAATVRLSLHARADEIQIQRLVGAGGLFVRLPFYLEGALQGGLAALAALLLLRGLYALGMPLLGDALGWLVGAQRLVFFGAGEAIALLGLGVGLGVGGALMSLVSLEDRP
ncbi:MAG: permease-like cell division protein FtsX [Myxococcota bacterium]